MDHLALAVSDQARSIRFYTHYFGFVPEPEPREDGVRILHDDAGFSLALARSRIRSCCRASSTSGAGRRVPTRCELFANA
jgi:catechol 2,3-dioxygenase-like lactoylglutathione lyase family enzyme